MVKIPRRTFLAVSVSLIVAGCGGGGGGGGGGGNPYLRPSVPYHTPRNAGTFTALPTSTAVPVADIFARDLNSDNVQEVVIAGRMSQPTPAVAPVDYNMQIFGWNTDRNNFQNETTRWFSGADNRIAGTEPAVRFGDFNGDGKIDMFVAHSTDSANYGPAKFYLNTVTGAGSVNPFTKVDVNLGATVWSHDATVVTYNDGGVNKQAVMVTDYGKTDGTPAKMAMAVWNTATNSFDVHVNSQRIWASSISSADYLGNGTNTIILTDTANTGNRDTKLFSWTVGGGNLNLTEISALPESRFYLPKWASQLAAAGRTPHEIRNLPLDFNGDGRTDVIVFSTLPNTSIGNNYHGYSEIQFLRNDGGGTFSDVTDTVLRNYNTSKTQTYQPVLVDVNNDGLLDILVSGVDWNGQASTSVLVRTSDGYFVEQYASVFTDLARQVGTPQGINIVRGPNDVNYLVTTVNAGNTTSVYLAQIGSFGTTTAPISLATLQSVWPWMSAIQANDALARTALRNFSGYDSNLHGLGIIDLESALNPIGGLGISLDGRTGQRRSISGFLAVPGMDRGLLSNITAVDGLSRDFQVDMSAMSVSPGAAPAMFSMIDQPGDSWGSRLVSNNLSRHDGLTAAGDEQRWTTGMTSRHFGWNSPYLLHVSMSQMPGSPYFAFGGVFGTIKQSTILDTSVTRQWAQGFWAQGGVMQTTTAMEPGLVRSVSPIYSAYAVGGYRDESWSLYGGLQPTIFAGSLELRLPTRVDSQGILHYTDKSINIRNEPVAFFGAEKHWRWTRSNSTNLGAVINTENQYQLQIKHKISF